MSEITDQMAVKWGQKRRGVRVNSRVPVAIEWSAKGTAASRDEAFTRVVGPYGCLVVFPHELDLEQSIRLTNLVSRGSLSAVVVWRGKQRPEGRELGIELMNPEMGFWGLEL